MSTTATVNTIALPPSKLPHISNSTIVQFNVEQSAATDSQSGGAVAQALSDDARCWITGYYVRNDAAAVFELSEGQSLPQQFGHTLLQFDLRQFYLSVGHSLAMYRFALSYTTVSYLNWIDSLIAKS
jgi:hypothetical protein